MPAQTYMVVDPRRDHSLRVPRPDLAAKLGTPDACTNCHTDQTSAWAAEAVRKWYGRSRRREFHFGEAIHAARTGAPGARDLLSRLLRDRDMPAIARATGLELSSAWLDETGVSEVEAGLQDPDPLLRMAALRAMEGLPPEQRWELGAPRLTDSVRSVRVEAVHRLAVPTELVPEKWRQAFATAAREFVAVHQHNADQPGAHFSLVLFHAMQDHGEEAEREYRQALRLNPRFLLAVVNLTHLFQGQGRDEEGEKLLLDALVQSPNESVLYEAVARLKVRRGQRDQSLFFFAEAARLAPEVPHMAFAYAVALNSMGQGDKAVRVLETAHRRHPGDRELLFTLTTIHRDRRDLEAARRFARKLLALAPNNRVYTQLWREVGGR